MPGKRLKLRERGQQVVNRSEANRYVQGSKGGKRLRLCQSTGHYVEVECISESNVRDAGLLCMGNEDRVLTTDSVIEL